LGGARKKELYFFFPPPKNGFFGKRNPWRKTLWEKKIKNTNGGVFFKFFFQPLGIHGGFWNMAPLGRIPQNGPPPNGDGGGKKKKRGGFFGPFFFLTKGAFF